MRGRGFRPRRRRVRRLVAERREPPRNWRHSYQEFQTTRRKQLQDARQRGERYFRMGQIGVVVNPSSMTDRQIEDAARLDAERVVNAAIHQYNEQTARER